MSEMVERMLAGQLGAELDRAGYGWAGKRALCRLMIEAMREPTEEMVEVGMQEFADPCWPENVRKGFGKMIDEALK